MRRHFGNDLSHPTLGPIALCEEVTEDYGIAEYFAVDTVKAINSGNVADSNYFRRYKLGHNDDDHVEITTAEAAEFVRRDRARFGR